MTATSPHAVDVTAENFETEVVVRSREVPVVVDFWAPWCGPCRQLAPLLESLAAQSAGRFSLVKINVDESPEIAGAFGVQSIPFVVAIKDEQPVNHFAGLLPEDQLRQWLETFLPSPGDELMREAAELEATDPIAAESKYRAALEHAADNATAKIGLARVLLKQNRDQECREIISALEARGFLEPEAESIKSQLEVLTSAEETGGVQEARQAAEAEPENLSLRLKLADALAAARQFEEAFEICLAIIAQDKAGTGEAARQTMVKIFDLAGSNSQLVSSYRRKLATALY